MKRWYAALRSRNGALAGGAFSGAVVLAVVAVALWRCGATSTDTTRAGVDLEQLDGRWATVAVAVGTLGGLLVIGAVCLVLNRYREVPTE